MGGWPLSFYNFSTFHLKQQFNLWLYLLTPRYR